MNSLLIHRFWRSLVARAALRNRFAELGVSESKSGETTPLCMLFCSNFPDSPLIYLRLLVKSNVWGLRKTNSSVSNLDGSSVTTNLTLNGSNSNEKEVNESELPLNSLDNTTRPFTCPGCRIDFRSFSGFVLHIESRLCMSSMCHEIEDQLNACITRIFNTGRAWTLNPLSLGGWHILYIKSYDSHCNRFQWY